MPFQLNFGGMIPAGFSTENIKGPGIVRICTSEFVTSEDGETLISRLEEMAKILFGAIRPPTMVNPACVHDFLAIVRPDGSGTLFINELSHLAQMQPKRDVRAGEAVFYDDIADVQRVRLLHNGEVVEFPKDAGIAFFFPVGWRKGLFYDFTPLRGEARTGDLELVLGQHYAYLAFHERLGISASELDELAEQKWFPFITLGQRTIQNMMLQLRSGGQVDDILDTINDEVAESLPAELAKWQKNPVFSEHAAILQKAVERFLAKDYISAVSIVFPQIEGLLRSHHLQAKLTGPWKPQALIETAIAANPNVQHPHCLLLPAKFQAYLEKVFYAPFDPGNPQELTRHTVAHGVAPAADFNKKGATLGFLVLSQLAYYLITTTPEAANQK